ncbi:MAG: hypothetical protein ABIZ57_11380 [Candidatus Limnocylindria bacterium]
MTGDATHDDDDFVPISVRRGEVVPPEDPEDWTRPLTWVAALGMLAGPIVTLVWFAMAPPSQSEEALPATYLVAASLAAGAAATGATQLGAARASTATLGAGMFGALVIIMLGVVMAGERQIGVASPTLAHAAVAAIGGGAGTLAASVTAAIVARLYARPVRFLSGVLAGVAFAMVAVATLMPAAIKAG